MKWITKEEVKKAAQAGEMEALQMSLEHHQQGRDCTRGELVDAIDGGVFNVEGEMCACCGAKVNDNCPLGDSDGECNGSVCCGNLWRKTSNTFAEFSGNPTCTNFLAFKEAEGKVCDYIQGVIDEKKNVKDKKCHSCKHYEEHCSDCLRLADRPKWEAEEAKPELRHGDYGLDRQGFACMTIHTNGIEGLRQVGPTTSWLNANDDDYRPKIILGNIFADIAARGEELKEFEVKGRELNILIRKCGGDMNCVVIKLGNVHDHFNPDQLDEIISGLQKVRNYVQNRKGKESK